MRFNFYDAMTNAVGDEPYADELEVLVIVAPLSLVVAFFDPCEFGYFSREVMQLV
jgi:hypothetical protein